MVPDLRALKKTTSRDYWLTWITHGKPGTLMPAFAAQAGGPLTDAQIHALADYLHNRR
jgi:mono/diheme cytochrome c family protein